MQVGSLVECVANNVENPLWNGIIPEIGQIYTIRHIEPLNELIGVLVDEIKSDISPFTGKEWWHSLDWYREIQPPIDIAELVEESIKQTAVI